MVLHSVLHQLGYKVFVRGIWQACRQCQKHHCKECLFLRLLQSCSAANKKCKLIVRGFCIFIVGKALSSYLQLHAPSSSCSYSVFFTMRKKSIVKNPPLQLSMPACGGCFAAGLSLFLNACPLCFIAGFNYTLSGIWMAKKQRLPQHSFHSVLFAAAHSAPPLAAGFRALNAKKAICNPLREKKATLLAAVFFCYALFCPAETVCNPPRKKRGYLQPVQPPDLRSTCSNHFNILIVPTSTFPNHNEMQ